MKRVPIEQRIRKAMDGHLQQRYYDIMVEVFPTSQYPRAWNYSSNGGPPGCAMAFNAAIRRMGGSWRGMGSARTMWIPK